MIFKFLSKNFYISFSIVALIYFLDRLSKIYVIQLDKNNLGSDIFNSAYLNIVLIWNKGIAFGLLSFSESYLYNIISLIIAIIIIVLVIMSLKSQGLKRYSLLMIVGGALGNLHDRFFFNAVPDFIDFHIGNFHWFIFNVSDIFITLGVISMIVLELFDNKNEKNITMIKNIKSSLLIIFSTILISSCGSVQKAFEPTK
jgi:signal peptidase II